MESVDPTAKREGAGRQAAARVGFVLRSEASTTDNFRNLNQGDRSERQQKNRQPIEPELRRP